MAQVQTLDVEPNIVQASGRGAGHNQGKTQRFVAKKLNVSQLNVEQVETLDVEPDIVKAFMRTPAVESMAVHLPLTSPRFAEMCCGTEAGSYLRLRDSCITRLRLKDLLGTVTRVKKKNKKKKNQGLHAHPRRRVHGGTSYLTQCIN